MARRRPRRPAAARRVHRDRGEDRRRRAGAARRSRRRSPTRCTSLWQDRALAERLGQRGFDGVREHYSIAALDRSPAGGVFGRLDVDRSGSSGLQPGDDDDAAKSPISPRSTRRARGPLRVLSGVSFEMAPGDAAAIMGPSGSGKSSLLYILGGLEPPSSGTRDARRREPVPAERRRSSRRSATSEIGFVFQDHCLLPQCTVLENVLIPTLVAPGAERRMRRARAQLIEQVGLADRIDHRPAELSGGERQRVAIARALVRQPRLLLCDEPTGNLDRAAADNVAAVLLDLHRLQNTILIVVTHSAAAGREAAGPLRSAGRQLTQSMTADGLITKSQARRHSRSSCLCDLRDSRGLVMSPDSSSGLRHYWRTNLAVIAGVATAVAVLAGALLVGDSVRGSLRDLVLAAARPDRSRGRVDRLLPRGARRRSAAATRASRRPSAASRRSSSCRALVTEQGSGRRASRVQVYGVDDRFWQFHGVRAHRARRTARRSSAARWRPTSAPPRAAPSSCASSARRRFRSSRCTGRRKIPAARSG